MTTYKNQHYVPEFYLEGWASDRWVTPLHLESGHEEPDVDISDICSRNYFYTLDDQTKIEEVMGNSLESNQAKSVKAIRQGKRLPDLTESELRLLSSFILTQRTRTRVFREEMINFGEDLLTEGLREDWGEVTDEERFEDISEDFVKERIVANHLFLMMHGILGFCIQDLRCILLQNRTSTPFISSDSPVVFDNPRFKFQRQFSYIGMANRGLMVYCPVDPWRHLLLFDPAAYNVDLDNSNGVIIEREAEVQKLNLLQVLNSGDVVFYRNPGLRDEVLQLHDEADGLDLSSPITQTFEIDGLEDREYEYEPAHPVPGTEYIPTGIKLERGVRYEVQRVPTLASRSERTVNEILARSDTMTDAICNTISFAENQYC